VGFARQKKQQKRFVGRASPANKDTKLSFGKKKV
jgi:hypothetical protein